jgi:DNA-binding response OmpR family regulator
MKFALHHHDASEMRRLVRLLEAAGGGSDCFRSPEAVMHAVHHGDYGAALLDTREQRDIGEVLLGWLACRASGATALLLLCPDNGADSMVRALDAGADDVVHSPVTTGVLAARLRALCRRSQRTGLSHQRIRLGDFLLDRATSNVQDGHRTVDLTPREFALAWFLFSRPCAFVTREAITMGVWGVQAEIAEHTLEQHISRLRKKLGLSHERGLWIRAAYGRGYRLEVQAPVAKAPLALGIHGDALAMACRVEAAYQYASQSPLPYGTHPDRSL